MSMLFLSSHHQPSLAFIDNGCLVVQTIFYLQYLLKLEMIINDAADIEDCARFQ